MQVQRSDDLRLYSKDEVAQRAGGISRRQVEKYAADPGCPLKWTHRVGRRPMVDESTLAAFLGWLRSAA